MAKYIALRPILYAGRQHKPGEVISCDDDEMIELWLKNKAVQGEAPAVVVEDEISSEPIKPGAEDVPTVTESSEQPPKLGRSRRKSTS